MGGRTVLSPVTTAAWFRVVWWSLGCLALPACANHLAVRERGRALVEQGKAAHAVPIYAEALQESPDDPILWLGYGEALLYAGKIAESEEALSKAIALGAGRDAEVLIARAHRWQGKNAQAASRLQALLQQNPEDAEVHFELGSLRLEAGDNSGAIDSLQTALGLHPGLANAYVNLARAHMRMNRLGEAKDVLEAGRTHIRGPASAPIETTLGEVYEATGNHPSADRAFIRALGRDPNHAPAVAGRARAHLRASEFAEAVVLLRGALQKQPQEAPLHAELGRTYHAYGMPDEAIGAFSKAVELGPGQVDIYPVLLELMASADAPEKQVYEILERASRYMPDDLDLQLRFARAAQKRRQHQAVLDAVRRVIERKPSHVEANFLMGMAQLHTGDLTGARDTAEALQILNAEMATQLLQALEKAQNTSPEPTPRSQSNPKKKKKKRGGRRGR